MSQLSRAFASLEQIVSAVVVQAVDKPVVANAIFDAGRAGRAGMDLIGDVRGTVVHLLALPSHHDVRQLDARVARLGVAMTELEAQLDDLRSVGPGHRD